jgi:hypothetical protein
MNKILCCLQPTYLPWIPFFERILISDIFIILDDVEFSKNSNHNRNHIKNNSNKQMLTVPVKYKNRIKIKDIQIDNSKNWKKKHWSSIKQSYSKLKFFKGIEEDLEEIYSQDWDYLSQLNIKIIKLFLKYLNINKEIFLSSELNIDGSANVKLINLCKYFNAKTFIVKKNTENYHPKEIFLKNDIQFKYFSNKILKYNQSGNNFIPNLSILDYISNCGIFLKKNES